MRKDWKYIFYLSIAFAIFVVLKLLSPKQHDWTVTFSHEDKNPYGTYAFAKLLPTIFKGHEIDHSYQTLYEIKDSLNRKGSIVSISLNFDAGKEDITALLHHVSKGGSAFISAHYFTAFLYDTLSFNISDNMFSGNNFLESKDTILIDVVNPKLNVAETFYFRKGEAHNYFSHFDSTKASVIARNEDGKAVTLRIKVGKGDLLLNTTPYAFTNFYLLSRENHQYISSQLSYLPMDDVQWTEYYHLGRMTTSTPLRYILTNEPLSWAYYISILSLLLFMLFEMKRKQRPIPVIKPLANTTLEFVRTIGNLYFQSGDHKSVADKKINYFLDHVRTNYWLQHASLDENFILSLTQKSGKPEADIRALITNVRFVQSQVHIGADRLIDLNQQLEKFYHS